MSTRQSRILPSSKHALWPRFPVARKQDYFQINNSQSQKAIFFFFFSACGGVRTVMTTGLEGEGVKNYFSMSTWTPALLPHQESKGLPWPRFPS